MRSIYSIVTAWSIYKVDQWTMLAGLLLAGLIALTGCGDEKVVLPPPAGAAAGQNTFLLFFTDN